MILISTPLEEYRVELITRLRAKDPGHTVYETALPPDSAPYPFYYLEELRAPDDRSCKREVMQEVSHSVSVWHNDPDKKAEVLKLLAKVGEVIQDIVDEGTTSYTWTALDTGMRCFDDKVSSSQTVFVHGIYEIHLKQIGSK